jgi:GrpB-like predicted nucleotidyltransferase (UPF0157 family)
MKSLISSQSLALMRPYSPILIGSAAYGNVYANDIDMLICVPVEKLGEVEGQLSALGFTRQTPDPETLDPRVYSAWKSERLDIQIALPGDYESKAAAHREVLRKRLYKGLTKAARYALSCSLFVG